MRWCLGVCAFVAMVVGSLLADAGEEGTAVAPAAASAGSHAYVAAPQRYHTHYVYAASSHGSRRDARKARRAERRASRGSYGSHAYAGSAGAHAAASAGSHAYVMVPAQSGGSAGATANACPHCGN